MVFSLPKSLDYASSMVQINFGSDWFSCSSITHASGGFLHPATPWNNLRAARSGAPACRSWFQSWPCSISLKEASSLTVIGG
jgi:hypothetical protein